MLPASMKPLIASISKCASYQSWSIFPRCFHRVWVGLCSERLSHVHSVSLGVRLCETSRIFWTILSVSRGMLNRIPSGFFFLPRSSLESLLCSPGFQGYSSNLVPQIRIVAKRDNMLSLWPLANQVKSFPEIFSTFQIAFLREEKNGCKSGYRKNVVSFMILKRCSKLCHSSRVKLRLIICLLFGFWSRHTWFGLLVQVDSVK